MKIFLALLAITATVTVFGADIERNTDGSISISGEYWVNESLSLDENLEKFYKSFSDICKEKLDSQQITTNLLLYKVESNNEIFSSGPNHIQTRRSVSIKIDCQVSN